MEDKMKILLGYLIIVLSLLIGCQKSNNQGAERLKARRDSIKTADSLRQVRQAKLEKRRKAIEEAAVFQVKIQNKIKEGKAIVLSENGESMPIQFVGDKAIAVKMPDGSLWHVEQKGNKNILHIPNVGRMEEKMINGKMMAVMPDSNIVVMSRK
jgi:hypothetical protein